MQPLFPKERPDAQYTGRDDYSQERWATLPLDQELLAFLPGRITYLVLGV